MTTLTAQQIACVYAWLAQLFSRELDDEQLTQIASAQMAEWFSLLKSEPPLTAAVNGLENSIATLTVRDDARLELAADFCGLFLMTDKQAALPYASAYKQDEQEIKRLLVGNQRQFQRTGRSSGDLSRFVESSAFFAGRGDRSCAKNRRFAAKNTDGSAGMVTRVCCALSTV